jgi:ectoine hydroxylase-related dioxygenase (phytanoyl-CoA dioxygenase family)
VNLEILKDEYTRNGYVIVRDVFDDETLSNAIASFADLRTEDKTTNRFGADGAVDFSKIRSLAERSIEFRELAMSKRIAEILALVLDDEPLLFRDVLVSKPALKGSYLEFHQDSAYWDVQPQRLASAWIPFQNVTEENGALLVVPGSHDEEAPHDLFLGKGNTKRVPRPISKALRQLVSLAGTGDSEKVGSPQLRKMKNFLLGVATKRVPLLSGLQDMTAYLTTEQRQSAVVVDVNRGDVVIFHSLLLHASSTNTSPANREAYIASYMGANFRYTGVGNPSLLRAIGAAGAPEFAEAKK